MGKLRPRSSIVVDIGPLLESVWTGIPVFTRRLIKALEMVPGLDVGFAYRITPIPGELVRKAIKVGGGVALRNYFDFDAPSRAAKLDLAGPLFYPMVKEMAGVSPHEASTIHDLTTLLMPEMHDPANVAFHLDHLREQLSSDEVVFCVSDAVRTSVVEAFPSVAPKAEVLYQYVDWPEPFAAMEQNSEPMHIGRYAIVIGTIEPRKNLRLLFRALQEPMVQSLALKYVIMGRQDRGAKSVLADYECAENVFFTGFISEFMKYRLIYNAEFLIFPSLYEGFGIPALEAMSLGKPVLASFSSSLPEVVGDAGIYFDPLSLSEFTGGLKAIADPRLLVHLAPKALARDREFSAERMAAPVRDWLSQC